MMSRVCPSCARSDVPCTSTLATLCPVCLAELRPGVVLAPVAVSHVPKAGDLLWVEVEEQVPELEACVQDGTCRPAAGDGGSAVTWKTALVTETLPGQRFVCCVNGENDFIEEVREAWTESTSGPLHPMLTACVPSLPRARSTGWRTGGASGERSPPTSETTPRHSTTGPRLPGETRSLARPSLTATPPPSSPSPPTLVPARSSCAAAGGLARAPPGSAPSATSGCTRAASPGHGGARWPYARAARRRPQHLPADASGTRRAGGQAPNRGRSRSPGARAVHHITVMTPTGPGPADAGAARGMLAARCVRARSI